MAWKKKREKVEVKDAYWWLGPVGVTSVVLLIFLAMIRTPQPVPLDERVHRATDQIKRTLRGQRQAIWLGMQISPSSKANEREFGIKPRQKGVIVTDIDNGQGADAGINVGDVIVAINGSKISDFESFLWLAKQSKFSEGILLDVITNGKRRFVSMPFLFEGGPLFGPKTHHWQLGAPLNDPGFGYGKLVAFTNNNQNQAQNMGTGFGNVSPSGAGWGAGGAQSFVICPKCGHSAMATSPNPHFCPNCKIQMLRNQ